MSTDTGTPVSEASADLKAMIARAFHGKPVAPDVARRVEERGEAIRKRLLVTNIAVDLIREIRKDI
ncbi:MAG TPA: hypothetical protein VGH74_07440 [Planctomycetaceae bacterium]|jgi:hypothetical protein